MIQKKPVYALLFLTMPTLMVVVAVLVLMSWRIPTHVQVDLTVDRAAFSIGGPDWSPILHSVNFQSISFEKFAYIKFSPEKLEVADPAQYILTEDRYLESAWKSLTVTPPVVITAEGETLQPAVTLESAKLAQNIGGILDRVRARPHSKVTVEVRGTRMVSLTIKVDRKESFADLSFREPFQLVADYARVSGITELPYKAASLTYRGRLPNHSPIIRVNGQPSSMVLILTIIPEKTIDPFCKRSIPVTALDFTRQEDETGNALTTLVKNSKITYPDYPKVEKVTFKPPDFIGLDRLKNFRIEEIALDPKHKGIRLRLNGVTGHVRTGSREFFKDHRLTLFDTLWHNPRLMVLLSIIVWLFPTTAGGYRLYKELRG